MSNNATERRLALTLPSLAIFAGVVLLTVGPTSSAESSSSALRWSQTVSVRPRS